MTEEAKKKEEIGRVTHYFRHVEVAAIGLSGPLKVGDTIYIKGHTTDLTEAIDSMEIDNKPVTEAGKGDVVGIKVQERVRPHDIVYKME